MKKLFVLQLLLSSCVVYTLIFVIVERCKVSTRSESALNDENKIDNFLNASLRSTFGAELHLVITYVNGSEEGFQRRLRDSIKKYSKNESLPPFSTSRSRFVDHDDLRFLLRSIDVYGQIFHRIFLVVADEMQIPKWLKLPANGRVNVVFHRDIWRDPSELPTFNSLAIEANLHRINGLADLYVYCNDDVAFVAPVKIDDFFTIRRDGEKAFVERFTARSAEMQLPRGLLSNTDKDAHFVNPAIRSRDLVLHGDVCESSQSIDMLRRYVHHAPHAFIKSVMVEAERVPIVREALERTWRSRFRSGEETNVVHFFNVYAQCGHRLRARKGNPRDAIFLRIDVSIISLEEYAKLASALVTETGRMIDISLRPWWRPKYVIVNDETLGNTTTYGRSFSRLIELWRTTLFPRKSSFEI